MDINLLENPQKRSKIGIYVDANRTPTEVPEGYVWVVLRSYGEFTNYITEYYKLFRVMPELFSFDHDLTQEYLEWFFMHPGERIVEYQDFKTKSGLHCARWLVEVCEKNNISLESTLLASHSHNESGRGIIIEYLNNYKRKKYGPAKANAFEKDWKFKYENQEEDFPQDGILNLNKNRDETKPANPNNLIISDLQS